jgi:hypothetical protein
MIMELARVTGSEDRHLLKGNNPTRVGFMLVGTADPAVCAPVRSEGKSVPFANHNPKCLVV